MVERPVVSNTTPLIVLAGIGHLWLLPDLYGEIWVAESVRAEFAARPAMQDPDLDQLPWLHVQAVVEPTLPLPQLDQGEADTIRLALALQARVILLDERLGRRVARDLALPVAGSLAVLLRARQQGLIPAVAPLLDEMVAQGRYLSAALRRQVLIAAGET
ncbi:MAG: DUF3368 domain-containing protein [Ardenticatenales bacterium]|nr:DUF3368 domain-containing protein [Ardenticatenales bacterium]